MKCNTLLISATLNVGLLITLSHFIFRSQQSTAAPSHDNSVSSVVTQNEIGSGRVAQSPFIWAQLESTNYLQYVSNLKHIGCPWETICDLITSEVNRLYAPKFLALARSNVPPFWKSRPIIDQRHDPTFREKVQQLKSERRTLIRAILGPEATDVTSAFDDMTDSEDLSFLPSEKASRVAALKQWLYDQRNTIIKTMKTGTILPSDQATLNQVSSSFDSQLKQYLAPSEYAEFQMRFSERAEDLRRRLDSFQPSETEFRGIYELISDFESSTSGPEARASNAALLEQRLQTFLGEDRYNEYLRSTDPAFEMLQQVGNKYNLPADVVLQAYNTRKAFIDTYSAILANQSLPTEARLASIQTAVQNAQSTLVDIMGKDAFNDYAPSDTFFKR